MGANRKPAVAAAARTGRSLPATYGPGGCEELTDTGRRGCVGMARVADRQILHKLYGTGEQGTYQ